MAIYLKSRTATGPDAPEGILRWDIAWSLFLPNHVGDIPAGYPEMMLGRLTAWAWGSLGEMAGRMRVDRVDPVWFIVPPLSPAGEEYVVRIASFWDDDVYWATESGERVGANLWLPPVTRVAGPDMTSALDAALQGDVPYGPTRNRVLFPTSASAVFTP